MSWNGNDDFTIETTVIIQRILFTCGKQIPIFFSNVVSIHMEFEGKTERLKDPDLVNLKGKIFREWKEQHREKTP